MALKTIFKISTLLLLLGFSVNLYSQKPILNRPLSVSFNAAKHYHIGKIAQNENYPINQSGFNAQFAATYRMWEYWGLSLKFDYCIIPMDASAIAQQLLNDYPNAREVNINTSSTYVSQLGIGYYQDFPIDKKIFIRVMPYVGLSVLKSPTIRAEIADAPNVSYKQTSGTSTGFFYELQVKPTYALSRELRVNAFVSYSGGHHQIDTKINGTATTSTTNFNYGRISAGIGIEIALPWIEMNWKY